MVFTQEGYSTSIGILSHWGFETLTLACARLSDSPRAFFAFLITERLSTTISEPGTGYPDPKMPTLRLLAYWQYKSKSMELVKMASRWQSWVFGDRFQKIRFDERPLRRKMNCSVFVSITFNKYYLKIINIISTININNNKYIKSLLRYRGTELVHFTATSHSRMAIFFACQKVILFKVITTLQIYCNAA